LILALLPLCSYDFATAIRGRSLAREQRRLAAIMAVDVVGYSRLMGRDESGTLQRLREHRKIRFEPALTRHGGRLVKLTGDGALAEFASAVDALGAAIEFQQAMIEANCDQPADTTLVFRVGLHVGDLIVDGDDLYGDGVNVAARLEGEAPAGGILISRNVRDAVAGRVKATFEDLGGLSLKNIERPVRAFRVGWDPAAWPDEAARSEPPPASGASLALALPDKPSIAVLPFQNMSGDPEQEYFADGMVEDIITALSHFKSLFVIARNSSFTYKGKAVDIRQVGRELGVRYVLEGSVRKAGSRVRITGQLIQVDSGAHIWAERYDGDLADIFDLQDRLTGSVVGAIAPKLEQAEIERSKRKPTESLDAYDYFLRGMAMLHQGTRESISEALKFFYRATELDSNFAAAYGVAAWCYDLRKWNGWIADQKQETTETERLARRAIEIGKDDPVALCWGGFALAHTVGDLDQGSSSLDRALVLNPNLATAWHWSGWVCTYLGDPETGIERVGRAMRLSPLDPFSFLAHAAMSFAHFVAAHYEEAIVSSQTAARERPNFLPAMRILAASYAMSGRLSEGQAAMVRVRQLDPAFRVADVKGVTPLRRAEDLARYEEALRLAGLPE
jgi:TolB-like protein/class 3 adenylate cyclase/tetratricopeptide (TPR) repeat protein